MICTSNLGDGGNEEITNGLVHGHAYSLLRIEEIEVGGDGETQKLVKIRNPWGENSKTEWMGSWGDGSAKWNDVSDEEKVREFISCSIFHTTKLSNSVSY